MARYFNDSLVELLAPAGNIDILLKLIDTGADAFYFGGKKHNMRMHRADFNFSDKEIEQAVSLIHSRGKKAYITVNNLMFEDETDDVLEYLKFLEKVKPDAIIVQDLGIVHLINKEGINLEIHTSVMMNQHNSISINELKKLGVTRVVASREMPLKDIKTLKSLTDVEFEYFTHGDMCVAHGAQCLYSSMVFGKSSNRGKCMKPCRWDFDIEHDSKIYSTSFPLAVKDMYMYENIPELINFGVTSFKIEGRMRTEDYLINIINLYADSIDRYINDPINYDRKKGSDYLYEHRKRDLSTGYAFGNPGLDYINQRYEGTGKFYSTGKVFSNPVKEFSISDDRIDAIADKLKNSSDYSSEATAKATKKADVNKNTLQPSLSVRINSKSQLEICGMCSVDRVYINMYGYVPTNDISLRDLKDFKHNYPKIEVFVSLPRMSYEEDHNVIDHMAKTCKDFVDGFLVTNLGQLKLLHIYDYKLFGDYAMNIANSKAYDLYKSYGLSVMTPSVECKLFSLASLLESESSNCEVIVHGSPVVMYMEHDLFENIQDDTICKMNVAHSDLKIHVKDEHKSTPDILYLRDDASGIHPVLKDTKSVNHMLLEKDLCLIRLLDSFINIGTSMFRIEGAHLESQMLMKIIQAYKYALDNKKYHMYKESFELVVDSPDYSLGALKFD